MPRRIVVRRAAVILLLAGVAAVITIWVTDPDPDPPWSAPPRADVNGDGFADLMVSAPKGLLRGQPEAGRVAVVDGSAVSRQGAQSTSVGELPVLSRAVEGVPGDPAAHESWGERSVARDLDGDGFTDLAVGSRSADVPTLLWGSPDGLMDGTALSEKLGAHGSNLVGGDFNGDGHVDLVADHIGRGGNEGDLRVLYGPFDRSGRPDGTGTLAGGSASTASDVVAGDVTGDGADDLVSMHEFEEMSEQSRFWKGSDDGLEDDPVKLPDAAAGTVGDVDGDGFGDLVLRTVPNGYVENLPGDHGTLKVLYGSADGPGERTTTIDQGTSGVPGGTGEGDQFGYDLSAGDVDADGYADIAVGVPYESFSDKGAVVLLMGGEAGLSGWGAQLFDQATPGMPGRSEVDDQFGSAVSLQDIDGDGRSDLAIGAPGEDGAEGSGTGAVWVLRGTNGGLTTDGAVSLGPGRFGGLPRGARLGSGFPE